MNFFLKIAKYLVFLLLVLFLLFGFCTVVQAQRSDRDEEYSKVDNSRIEVFYNYTAIDTVLSATQDYRCVLQIGDNSSLFRSYSSYHRDSMMIQLMDSVDHQRRYYLVSLSQFEKRISSNYFRRYLYKWAEKEFDSQEIVGQTLIRYQDPDAQFDWTITADTMTLHGYLCTKATAHFRGRTWNVWFAEDIPYSLGPWKFNGLPGLVVHAEDAEGIHLFEMEGIRNSSNICHIPKGYLGDGPKPVKRKEALEFEKKICNNYASYMASHPDFMHLQVEYPQRYFYAPLELE